MSTSFFTIVLRFSYVNLTIKAWYIQSCILGFDCFSSIFDVIPLRFKEFVKETLLYFMSLERKFIWFLLYMWNLSFNAGFVSDLIFINISFYKPKVIHGFVLNWYSLLSIFPRGGKVFNTILSLHMQIPVE